MYCWHEPNPQDTDSHPYRAHEFGKIRGMENVWQGMATLDSYILPLAGDLLRDAMEIELTTESLDHEFGAGSSNCYRFDWVRTQLTLG